MPSLLAETVKKEDTFLFLDEKFIEFNNFDSVILTGQAKVDRSSTHELTTLRQSETVFIGLFLRQSHF